MKKIVLIALAILMTVSLAACSVQGETQAEAATDTESASALAGGKNGTSPLVQLMIGTFKLEGTDQAVTAEQAAKLLPLWKAYRTLNSSDSASAAEMEALLGQIEGAMTEVQLEAIAALELDMSAMQELMTELGIEMPAGGTRGDMTEEQRATMQAQRAAGGGVVPGQGRPGGGGVPGIAAPGGEQPSAEQIETLRAERAATGGGGMMIQGPLFDALIDLLQGKA